MAKTSLKIKQARLEERYFAYKEWRGPKPKKGLTKFYNRCKVCWREGSYYREFGICRCCLRTFARQWLLMGVKKASR